MDAVEGDCGRLGPDATQISNLHIEHLTSRGTMNGCCGLQ